jgi:hypothetical protein
VSHGRYILDGKVPVPCEDLITWAKWIETSENRVVKQEWVGDLWVSTVFLALDHNWGSGPPLLFETLIFRDATDKDRREMEDVAKRLGIEGKVTCPQHIELEGGFGTRTATWELALEAHAEGVAWAKKRLH